MTLTVTCLGAGMFLCLPLAMPPGEDEREVFEIVSIRNASDVAAVMPPEGFGDDIIGRTIVFTGDGLEMEGASCDDWQRAPLADMPVNAADPMLADTMVEPVGGPASSGDARTMKSWSYSCEGEHVLSLTRVDDRVLIIPWNNGMSYLIAEKPLSDDELLAFQAQLKDMKFLNGEPSGEFDEDTRNALSFYASYRVGGPDAYAFQRAAITENLLDGLNVLDMEDED